VTVGASPVFASQDSVFTPTFPAGTGSIIAGASPGDRASVQSLYDVTFDVPVTTPCELVR
jgi:hypothetical protein